MPSKAEVKHWANRPFLFAAIVNTCTTLGAALTVAVQGKPWFLISYGAIAVLLWVATLGAWLGSDA